MILKCSLYISDVLSTVCVMYLYLSVIGRTDKQDICMFTQVFHAYVDYQTLSIVSHYRQNAKQERYLYCMYILYLLLL